MAYEQVGSGTAGDLKEKLPPWRAGLRKGTGASCGSPSRAASWALTRGREA